MGCATLENRPRDTILVIEEASEEEANQETDHHKEDNDWAWNIAHDRLTSSEGM
jgi:hypothetical protein